VVTLINIKQLAKEIEKHDILFWGNIADIVKENSLTKQQTKELFKELENLGMRLSNTCKSYIYGIFN
jgi:hypothetical protein